MLNQTCFTPRRIEATLRLATALYLLASPASGFAQWTEPPERAPWAMFSGVGLSVGYQHVTLAKPFAREHAFGTAAGGVNVAFGARLWRLLSLGVAFGGASVADRGKFTMTTITCPTPSPCDERSGGVVADMMSDVGSLTITGTVGLGPPPIAFGNLLVTGGFNFGAFSATFKRSIAECIDCTFGQGTTVGGSFIELNAWVGLISLSTPGSVGEFGWTVGVSGSYRYYLKRDMLDDGWSLGGTIGGVIGDAVWRPTYIAKHP